MIEVHLMGQEPATAVHARDSTEIPEELDRRPLPRHDAVDLSLSILLVVPDVVWALVARARHRSNMTTRVRRVNRTGRLDDAPRDRMAVTLPHAATELEVYEVSERLRQREPLLVR